MLQADLWFRRGSVVAVSFLMAAAILGCASKQEKALEQAKKQAMATGQPQQVVSVDQNGVTTTAVVQPVVIDEPLHEDGDAEDCYSTQHRYQPDPDVGCDLT